MYWSGVRPPKLSAMHCFCAALIEVGKRGRDGRATTQERRPQRPELYATRVYLFGGKRAMAATERLMRLIFSQKEKRKHILTSDQNAKFTNFLDISN